MTNFTKKEVVDFLKKSTTATKMINSLKGIVDHVASLKLIKEDKANKANKIFSLDSNDPIAIIAKAKEDNIFDKDVVAKALMDFKKVRSSKSLWVIKTKNNELKFRKDFFSFAFRKSVWSPNDTLMISNSLIDEVIIDFDHPTNSHLFVDFAFGKATFDDVVNAVADDVLSVLAAEED